MKFPSFKKTTTVKASEPKPSVVLPSAPNSLLPRLCKHLSFHSVALPDSVRIPANGTTRPDEVIRTLTNATIDDIAFAIQGTEAECSAIIRRSGALKELYEAARKRGANGTTTVADAFASLSDEELRK